MYWLPVNTPKKCTKRTEETWFSSKDCRNRVPMKKTKRPSIAIVVDRRNDKAQRTLNQTGPI
jgi:hypothetical protein